VAIKVVIVLVYRRPSEVVVPDGDPVGRPRLGDGLKLFEEEVRVTVVRGGIDICVTVKLWFKDVEAKETERQ
jgi:hypothetical protein